MKLFILIFYLLLLTIATQTAPQDQPHGLDESWFAFKKNYGKQYQNDEEKKRKNIFGNSLKIIQEHNLKYSNGQTSYNMSVNEYADLTNEEFNQIMNGYKINGGAAIGTTLPSSIQNISLKQTISASVDWRTLGYVTPVKNQGYCGSCWAFSATGSMEGMKYRTSGKLVRLSEQNLLDCSSAYGNGGCNGGLMNYAFQYVKQNGGIDTEQSYPYVGQVMRCSFRRSTVGAKISGYVNVASGDEAKLMEAVATIGPVSVAINAGLASFQYYSSGIYDDPLCTNSLNHGVLAVGYGTENGQDYWIVKNSWGTSWGNGGYIKMARNKGNQCGIASMASYPLP